MTNQELKLLALKEEENKFLNFLVTEIKKNDKENTYLKIDKSNIFMPLIAELICEEGNSFLLSLAHYGKQKGDLMADPEIIYAYREKENVFIPFYFKNDYIAIEEIATEKYQDEMIISKLKDLSINMQLIKALGEFSRLWFKNIIVQQEISF